MTLFTQAFAGLAEAVAMGQQAPGLPKVVLPHPLNDRPEETIRGEVAGRLEGIVAALTTTPA